MKAGGWPGFIKDIPVPMYDIRPCERTHCRPYLSQSSADIGPCIKLYVRSLNQVFHQIWYESCWLVRFCIGQRVRKEAKPIAMYFRPYFIQF